MAICASRVVGWASRWEVVKRLGGISAGGIASRKVVDVPKERIASPGVDRATIVAGLSPVNDATMQSEMRKHDEQPESETQLNIITRIETPPFDPPFCY